MLRVRSFALLSLTSTSCIGMQADGTLEESSATEDAEPPHLSKRRRTDGDAAHPGTAAAEPAQGAAELLSSGREHQTRQRAHAEGFAQRPAAGSLAGHPGTAAFATAPSLPSAAPLSPPRSRPAPRGASRLGSGHASARSASMGERRSIQLLLSAVVEELHRHESEPAGGARLTLDDHPQGGADAAASSRFAESGSGAAISAGTEAGVHAQYPSTHGAGASVGRTDDAPLAAAPLSSGLGGLASPSTTAPASDGAPQPPGEAPHSLDVSCPEEGSTPSAPSPAPRRGPLPPVSPFAVVQSSGCSPDKETAPDPRPDKVTPRLRMGLERLSCC